MNLQERQIQRGTHLADQGWAYLATRHGYIQQIALGNMKPDRELQRIVFAAVDNELFLKKFAAEAPR